MFILINKHGDIAQQERDLILSEFRTGASRVLITCSSHSRGIDVQQLGLVINVDLPAGDVAEFVHRAGRAGRYGRVGAVISFVTPSSGAFVKQIERDCGMTMKPVELEDLSSKSIEALCQY
jgi:ATP-dependent RNA helicase